jgi:hypothetical protein
MPDARVILAGLFCAVAVLLAPASSAFATITCGPGTYSNTGNSPCTNADPGFYVPSSGSTHETPCAPGTHNPNSSSTSSAACAGNDPGFYSASGAAAETPCGPGTFDPNADSASSAACQPDPPGSYSASGAAAQTLCLPGTFAASSSSAQCTYAAAGYFVDTAGAVSQTPCPAGTNNPIPDETSAAACVTDPADTYSAAGAPTATGCPNGTTSAPGSASCTPIPVTPSAPAPLTPSSIAIVPGSVDPYLINTQALLFRVSCTGPAPCVVRPAASVTVANLPTFQLTGPATTIAAGATAAFRLGDPAGFRPAVRRYLRHHRGLHVLIQVAVSGTSAGATVTAADTVALRTLAGLR